MTSDSDSQNDGVAWPGRPAGRQPLRGLRVLDFTAYAVGPWACALLAAMGADVLKVDPPYGDPIRNVAPQRGGDPTTYGMCNLGKRSVRVDLKDPAANAKVQRLARMADVVVENSRPGAMKRLGLDFEAIRSRNPGVVYCSSSSFGEQGPMSGVGSTDLHGQAFSGLVSITGAEQRPEWIRYHAVVDLSTAVCLVQACLIGLHWRRRNGEGCHVTTSQLEGALAIQVTRAAEFLIAGQDVAPAGAQNAAFAPSDAFRCRDGRYLTISAPDQETWLALGRVLGHPDLLGQASFGTNRERVANRHALSDAIAPTIASKDATWWIQQLGQARVPYGELFRLDDAVTKGWLPVPEPLVQRVPWTAGGTLCVGAVPWQSSTWTASFGPSIQPGQHQSEIFGAELAE
jgi:crotonobetainyl-CoA:carnitine CoA-transferase CaiB-like acyl-CoA transferase